MPDNEDPVAISTWLKAIHQAIKEHAEAAEKYHQAETSQRQEQSQTELKTVVRLPVEVGEYFRSEQGERPVKNRRENVRVILETCAVIAAFALAGITLVTLRTFNSQLTQMKEQTKTLSQQAAQSAQDSQRQLDLSGKQVTAAQDDVKAIQRQMRQDQRAWITIRPGNTQIADNQVIEAAFQIENSGKTLAKKFRSDSVLAMLKKGEEPDFTYDPRRVNALEIRSGIVLPHLPEGRLPNVLFRNGIPVVLDSIVHEELRKRNLLLIAYGKVSYWDIFGTPHWMTYCLDVGLPDAVPPVGLDTVTKKCTDYGNADNN
jgi:hypothetical protein